MSMHFSGVPLFYCHFTHMNSWRCLLRLLPSSCDLSRSCFWFGSSPWRSRSTLGNISMLHMEMHVQASLVTIVGSNGALVCEGKPCNLIRLETKSSQLVILGLGIKYGEDFKLAASFNQKRCFDTNGCPLNSEMLQFG